MLSNVRDRDLDLVEETCRSRRHITLYTLGAASIGMVTRLSAVWIDQGRFASGRNLSFEDIKLIFTGSVSWRMRFFGVIELCVAGIKYNHVWLPISRTFWKSLFLWTRSRSLDFTSAFGQSSFCTGELYHASKRKIRFPIELARGKMGGYAGFNYAFLTLRSHNLYI